jgi:mRNA degradation ribonuclease J1/J2
MDKMVNHEFVHKNQREVLMDLGFNQFAELIDIRADAGSHFIHSMSEPFSEEDIEDAVMHNWLDHFGMQFHQLHASGHMNRNQLTDFINYVKPKRIFPVHTENQQLFRKISNNVQTIKRGKRYEI